jgi:hopanoid biosynthesis associated protein HpnK
MNTPSAIALPSDSARIKPKARASAGNRARRLVVTADDFGRSSSINRAVIHAYREGILTSASLMVNGVAAAEAVALAREHPGLGVGLHLTLVRGQPSLPAGELVGWVDARGQLPVRPVLAGFRCFFRRPSQLAVEREVAAQFARFRSTGLALDHVDGHLHFHLHPRVVRLLLRRSGEWGIRAMRLTRDPLWLNLRLSGGRYGYRLTHALAFGWLARWIAPQFRARAIVHTDRVFGLLQDGRVDAGYVERLVSRLPPGDSELYAHSSFDEGGQELEALVSGRGRAWVAERGITLVRYQDL